MAQSDGRRAPFFVVLAGEIWRLLSSTNSARSGMVYLRVRQTSWSKQVLPAAVAYSSKFFRRVRSPSFPPDAPERLARLRDSQQPSSNLLISMSQRHYRELKACTHDRRGSPLPPSRGMPCYYSRCTKLARMPTSALKCYGVTVSIAANTMANSRGKRTHRWRTPCSTPNRHGVGI